MSLLPLKTAISDIYPLPSNATARTGFGALWDAINEFFQKSELDLASATTCDIGGQTSTKLRITGTTGITSFGTAYRGPIKLRFSGIVTITHNSTTLRCPGGASITTAANDVFTAWPIASVSGTLDGWQLVAMDRIMPLIQGGTGATSASAARASLGVVALTGNETIAGNKTFSGVTAIGGTATNDSAAAGYVGQFISSTVLDASAVSLTSSTDKTVTSISLTAGDWDVTGVASFKLGSATGVTGIFGCSSITNNTSQSPAFQHRSASFTPAADMAHTIPSRRLSLAGTTTVYLIATANFSGGTAGAFGSIEARRVR